MKKLILVCYASTGSGHKSAANSICDALNDICAADLHEQYIIRTVDMLDFCLVPVDGNKAATTYTGPLAPLHDVTWRYNFTGKIVWGGGKLFSTFIFPKFEKYFKNLCKTFQLQAVICTHMVAANVVGGTRAKLCANGDLDYFPLISVPTDYETEGLWPHKQTDLFCVPNNWTIETLINRRVDRSKIVKTGLPASPKFTANYDTIKVRQRYKIPQNKIMIIIMAGANESIPYVNFREELDKALDYFSDMEWMHFVVIAGKDDNYRIHLEQYVNCNNVDNFTILGFTENIAELMAASDLALCKAGGMTVTECLCARLPMVLVGKAYAQENINVRYLTSIGAAYHAITYKHMIEILCKLTSNAELYRAIKTNTNLVRCPDAAYDIARSVFIMMGIKTSRLPNCKSEIAYYVEQAYRRYRRNKNDNINGLSDILGVYIGNAPAHNR